MELFQCMSCGHGGYTSHELKDGLCLSCQDDDYDWCEYDASEPLIF